MSRRIGGQNFEGRYFIITVPDGWTENDPLPPPTPEDRWFDRLTDFKAELDCPWIRRPLRHVEYREPRAARPSPPQARAVGE
jgi:hypothetical protein